VPHHPARRRKAERREQDVEPLNEPEMGTQAGADPCGAGMRSRRRTGTGPCAAVVETAEVRRRPTHPTILRKGIRT